jgi:hypothetical protein
MRRSRRFWPRQRDPSPCGSGDLAAAGRPSLEDLARPFSATVGCDRLAPSGDHGSKYRVEVIGLGRQDWFSEPQSCFRSANLVCGAAHFRRFGSSDRLIRTPTTFCSPNGGRSRSPQRRELIYPRIGLISTAPVARARGVFATSGTTSSKSAASTMQKPASGALTHRNFIVISYRRPLRRSSRTKGEQMNRSSGVTMWSLDGARCCEGQGATPRNLTMSHQRPTLGPWGTGAACSQRSDC